MVAIPKISLISAGINTVISNLKTSFSGTFHALRFEKYADRHLRGLLLSLQSTLQLERDDKEILRATYKYTASLERRQRSAELST
jgi:hypothetical protein